MRQASLALIVLLLPVAIASAQGPQPPPRQEDDPRELFDEIDGNGDGRITRQEVVAMANQFFDGLLTHSPGHHQALTFEQVMEALPKLFAEHDQAIDLGGPDHDRQFTRLDRDGDGRVMPEDFPHPDLQRAAEQWLISQGRAGQGIHRGEFPGFIEATLRPDDFPPDPRPSGGPSGPEYGAPPSQRPPGPPDERAMRGRAFDMADTNNDGILSLDEVEPRERANFEVRLRAYGRDIDDGLSREEFVEGLTRDRMRAHAPGVTHEEGAYDDKRPSEYGQPGGEALTLE